MSNASCGTCQLDPTGVCEPCWDDSVRAHRSIATPLPCEDCGGGPLVDLEGLGVQADHASGAPAVCGTCRGHGLTPCSYCRASVTDAPAVQLVDGYPACEACALEASIGEDVEAAVTADTIPAMAVAS